MNCYFCHKEITPDTIGYFTFDFFPEPVDHIRIDGVGKFYICGECLNQIKANEGSAYEIAEALYQGYAMMKEGGDDIIDVEPVEGGEHVETVSDNIAILCKVSYSKQDR